MRRVNVYSITTFVPSLQKGIHRETSDNELFMSKKSLTWACKSFVSIVVNSPFAGDADGNIMQDREESPVSIVVNSPFEGGGAKRRGM